MRFFVLLLGISTLAACATDGGMQVSENGYEYIFFNDVPGEPIGQGGAGAYYLTVFQNDSLIQSVRDIDPDPAPFMLPDEEELVGMNEPNPMIDALSMMSVGDSLSIRIKLDTIQQRPQGFGKDDVLRYDLVLAEQMTREEYTSKQEERRAILQERIDKYKGREAVVADSVATVLAEYKRGASRAGFTTTKSGLQYKILEQGTGRPAANGKPVLVSYYGVLIKDGTMFDNSFRAQKPFEFGLGRGSVIAGWDEGIALLREGTRAVFAIPSDLAYGDSPRPGGPIGPGDDLMFYVQLEEVAP